MINASILKTFYKKTIPYIWGYGFFCAIVRSTFSNSSFAWLSRLPVKPGLNVNVKFSLGSVILTKPERCSIAKKFFWTDGKIQPKEDELAIEYFVKLAQKSKYILDIGSNSGIFSLISSKANPKAKVYAYDILPEAFHILIDNLIINNLMDSVTPYLKGVGKNSTFHAPINNITSEMPTSLKLDQDYSGIDSTIVEVKTLDDIFSDLQIDNQACIKIDVEGFEFDIFENSMWVLQEHRPYFLCEVLTTAPNYYEYNNLLSENNYNKYLITDGELILYEDIVPNIRFKDWLFIPKEQSEEVLSHLYIN